MSARPCLRIVPDLSDSDATCLPPLPLADPGLTYVSARGRKGSMLVRLTKKLAEVINGLDLSHCREGDVIELPRRDADMLLAEGWAEVVAGDVDPSCAPRPPNSRAVAADRRRPARPQPGKEAGPGDDLVNRLRRHLVEGDDEAP